MSQVADVSARVSVVIVSYGSRSDLSRCLPTVFSQSLPPHEVIVVDNDPSDGTAAWLRYSYPEVRVMQAPSNLGYAAGNNLGASVADGDFLFFLNPDTELHPGALSTLLAAVTCEPFALVTAKLLYPDGRTNACGLDIHYAGIATCRGLGSDRRLHSGLHEVPAVSGAAFIVAREVFAELGGFDASYFMYGEDSELSLRARLVGLKILCHGNAIVTHHHEPAMSPKKFELLHRNRWFMIATIYEDRTLRRMAPSLLFVELLICLYALSRGPSFTVAWARACTTFVRRRPEWLARRRELQGKRIADDSQILQGSAERLPFEQLVASPRLAAALDAVMTPMLSLGRRWVQGL